MNLNNFMDFKNKEVLSTEMDKSTEKAVNKKLAAYGFMTAKGFKDELFNRRDEIEVDDYKKAIEFVDEHPRNLYDDFSLYIFSMEFGRLPIIISLEEYMERTKEQQAG